MLEKIIAWSLSHRIAVLVGAAVVCLIGWVAVNRLVVDAFPDTTPVQVQINTVAPGMVAEGATSTGQLSAPSNIGFFAISHSAAATPMPGQPAT